MPTYDVLRVEGHRFGLNLKEPADSLAPGEAVVADNVEFSGYSVSQIRGHRNVAQATKDNVIRGGPAGDSLYVQGDQSWLEHDFTSTATPGGDTWREIGYHQRHGLIVIPEGGDDRTRCDVQTGDPDWAIEATLWSDDLRVRPNNLQVTVSAATYFRSAVVVAKSDGAKSNWAIRIIPEGADVSTRPRFHVVLTLYKLADHTFTGGAFTNGVNFHYQSGSARGWFDLGKRHWFSWRFNDSTGNIESAYWQEGFVGAALTSVQAIPSGAGTLRADGTSDGNAYPIVIGRRPLLVTDGPTGAFGEVGFNGVLGEFRFYAKTSGSGLTFPSGYAGSSWTYEREWSADEITTYAAAADLWLYYSFSTLYRSSIYQLPPRFDRTTPTARTAWLTGADCSWVGATTILGAQALSFIPPHTTAGQEDIYFKGVARKDAYFYFHSHGAGIRVPNGVRYMLKEDANTNSPPIAFPKELSVRATIRADALASGTPDKQVIWGIYRIRRGSPNVWEYEIQALFELALVYSSPNWKLEVFQRRAAGTLTLTSTGNLAANTDYSVVATTSFYGADYNTDDNILTLYVNGTRDSTLASPAAGRPPVSETTGSDVTGSNKNDDDKRDQLYVVTIGCSATTASSRTFWIGSEQVIGANTAGDRRYWSFYNNESPSHPNSGVLFLGQHALRCKLGSVNVWHKALTEAEIANFALREPNENEIAAYGFKLLSSWNMEEGKGNTLWDRGYLSNHLKIHPYPEARPVVGPIHRFTKSNVRGFWEVRTRTLREGVERRDIYGLASGSLCVLRPQGYWEPVAHRIHAERGGLPTAFQHSDFFYVCPGEGPVLRVSRGRVTPAGLSPVFGDNTTQHGDRLGWLPADRDGTFDLFQLDAASAPATVFAEGDKFQWVVTFWDAERAVESAPSRIMTFTIEAGAGFGAKSIRLGLLPLPHERNASHYRIYRTVENGGAFYFVDECPISQHAYLDATPDTKLGRPLNTVFNTPPPHNARIGVSFGSRALYSGVWEDPGTVWFSLENQPEAVPQLYRITVSETQSSRITGILTLQDRAAVFLQDAVYLLRDQGGDIGTSAIAGPPVAIEKVVEGIGCVSHHGIVWIPGLGGVFPGEKGLYVTTTLVDFQPISERIDPLWQTLKKTTYQNWHAVHHRKREQYILFCADGLDGDRNNMAIVWDYRRDAFHVIREVGALASFVVEDATTGENLLYFSDYWGQIHEWDPASPPDSMGSNLGAFATYIGEVQDTSTASAVKLFANPTIPTTGDGLRGVMLEVSNGVTSEKRRIIQNTASVVFLETPLSGTPLEGYGWRLGSIESEWRLGQLDFGDKTNWKESRYWQADFVPNDATVGMFAQWDERPEQRVDNVSAAETYRRMRVLGRGRRLQIGLRAIGGANHWEAKHCSITWWPRGRSSWSQ